MRRSVILASALFGLVACETTSAPTSPVTEKDQPEFAAVSFWEPIVATFPNECPPAEDVIFSGRAHFVVQESADGGRFFVNWAGVQGVGAVTGARYVIQDVFHERDVFTTTGGTAEWFEKLRLIRLGSLDNLVGLAHVIFDLGTETFVLFDINFKCPG